MNPLIMAQEGKADADTRVNLIKAMIKPEVVEDSASEIGKGIGPDTNLTLAQLDTAEVVKKEKAVDDSVLFLNKVEGAMAPHTEMFPELQKWRDQTSKVLSRQCLNIHLTQYSCRENSRW